LRLLPSGPDRVGEALARANLSGLDIPLERASYKLVTPCRADPPQPPAQPLRAAAQSGIKGPETDPHLWENPGNHEP